MFFTPFKTLHAPESADGAKKDLAAKPDRSEAGRLAGGLWEVLFEIGFLLWLVIVLQDWLLSSVTPYPYAASLGNTVGVVVGFAVFLKVRNFSLWQEAVVLGGVIVLLTAICGAGVEVVPSVAVLVTAWTTALLISGRPHQAKWRRIWHLAGAVLAASVLLQHAARQESLWHGIFAWLTTIGISSAVMASQLYDTSAIDARTSRFVRIVVTASVTATMALLSWHALWPSRSPSSTLTSANWMGSGLGTFSYPLFWPGVETLKMTLIHEHGLGTVYVVVFLFGLATVAAAWACLQSRLWIADRSRLTLSAASLGSLSGMLMGAQLGAPFMTVDTSAGTWALSLTLASIGLAVSPPRATQLRAAPAANANAQRGRRLYGSCALFATACMAIVGAAWWYQSTLYRAIEPYARDAGHSASALRLAGIAQPMQDATIAFEDYRFYEHGGLDWPALHRALRANLRAGQVRQGGSTITQQLAKTLFLSGERTAGRKLQEAALAWQMERMMTKAHILELYLNSIDYGMRQRGIAAAAHFYFHKTPARLSLAESAVLVGLVPDPAQRKLSPQRLAKGRAVALSRIEFRWPDRYSAQEIQRAGAIPITRLVYPFKTPYDRGAGEEIPAVWHGVSFFYAPNTRSPNAGDVPMPISFAAPRLKASLSAFVREARIKYGLSGIDHIGIFNDRFKRGSDSVSSAHAFGQAIDIAGFRFQNTSSIKVADHADARVLERLIALHRLLLKYFDVVIDWRTDPRRHSDHFHAEVKGPRHLSGTATIAKP